MEKIDPMTLKKTEGAVSPLPEVAGACFRGINGRPSRGAGKHPGGEAQSSSMIGIDVIPDTNQPSSLGELETCASADSGDLFAVDVFINNVDALTKWEARVEYDSDVLSLEEVDYNHFLVGSGGSVFPSLFELESDGRHFMAAAEFQTAPDSGSGTLARLTMRAVDEGRTTIRVVNTPGYLGPQLSGLVECRWVTPPDSIWDGEYLAGDVVVDGECDGDSPVAYRSPIPVRRLNRPDRPRREAEVARRLERRQRRLRPAPRRAASRSCWSAKKESSCRVAAKTTSRPRTATPMGTRRFIRGRRIVRWRSGR